MNHPDMLEHANRHDPVEALVHHPVVQQLERDAIGQPLGLGPRPGLAQLFGGQGDPGDPGAIVSREGQRHAAPAATNVEHRQTGPVQAELGGDVALLCGLRLFQGLGPLGEIGAGICSVAVQEQAV